MTERRKSTFLFQVSRGSPSLDKVRDTGGLLSAVISFGGTLLLVPSALLLLLKQTQTNFEFSFEFRETAGRRYS